MANYIKNITKSDQLARPKACPQLDWGARATRIIGLLGVTRRFHGRYQLVSPVILDVIQIYIFMELRDVTNIQS
jgi:hypothetical protein